MNAVISGMAGRALLLENDKMSLLDADMMGDPAAVQSAEWRRYFPEGDDLQFLENVSLEEARQALNVASACDEALLLARIVLDGKKEADLRREAAEELEALLQNEVVVQHLSSKLCVNPLPESADIEGAIDVCKGVSALASSDLFRKLKKDYPHTSRESQVFADFPVFATTVPRPTDHEPKALPRRIKSNNVPARQDIRDLQRVIDVLGNMHQRLIDVHITL